MQSRIFHSLSFGMEARLKYKLHCYHLEILFPKKAHQNSALQCLLENYIANSLRHNKIITILNHVFVHSTISFIFENKNQARY